MNGSVPTSPRPRPDDLDAAWARFSACVQALVLREMQRRREAALGRRAADWEPPPKDKARAADPLTESAAAPSLPSNAAHPQPTGAQRYACRP
jgi:hypothetical protein